MSSNRLLPALLAVLTVLWLWPAAANAAVTYLGSTVGVTYNGSGATVVNTLDHAVPIGGLVELGTIQDTVSTYCSSATDSRGNTYTIGAVTDFISNRHIQSLYSSVTTALQVGDTITTTCAAGANKVVMEAAFSGIDTVTTIDLPPANGDDSGTSTGSALAEATNNTQAGNLVIGWGIVNVAGTAFTGDSFTNKILYSDSTIGGVFLLSYSTAPTTAPITWTTSWTGSRTHALYVEAFKPGAAGAACNGGLLLRGAGGC